MLSDNVYKTYLEILNKELIEATGCTEPIAVALAGSKARELLKEMPEKVDVYCSGNIIKNVKGVVVPNSGNLKGIEAAVLLGMIAGKSDSQLQVISEVSEQQKETLKELLKSFDIALHLSTNVPALYIKVVATSKTHNCQVVISDYHTNISYVELDGKVLVDNKDKAEQREVDKSLLNVKDILEFATTCKIEDVKDVIQKQIEDNSAISKEGLEKPYGAQVGRTLIACSDQNVAIRARAKAAAGSDARMNGCPMAVVINSGSGNQGLTVSMPVITYATELKVSEEKLYRALIISNLVALHQKKYIGSLSAYCGAVSAAAGAGSAICWLKGGNYNEIMATITNTILTAGGMVCDGAKSSCAGKISIAVETALQSMNMAMHNCEYQVGEGMAKADKEDTIKAVGRMAKEGMASTDIEILNIMIEK